MELFYAYFCELKLINFQPIINDLKYVSSFKSGLIRGRSKGWLSKGHGHKWHALIRVAIEKAHIIKGEHWTDE